jgi:hypothetical protein
MLAREVTDDAGPTFCHLVGLVSAYWSLLESSSCGEVSADGLSCITYYIAQAHEASLNCLLEASRVMYCLVQGEKPLHFFFQCKQSLNQYVKSTIASNAFVHP